MRLGREALPGGGRGHMSLVTRVGVYKCFTSLSEMERKLFVFVGILAKGDSDAL